MDTRTFTRSIFAKRAEFDPVSKSGIGLNISQNPKACFLYQRQKKRKLCTVKIPACY